MKMTVYENSKNGLCCSCGICKSVCKTGAIRYQKKDGMFIPTIDEYKCINCGICADICPGYHQYYSSHGISKTPLEAIKGEVVTCYNAWSRNAQIRHVGASGGIVTTLVKELLNHKVYDCAFCVDNYTYDNLLSTEYYTSETFSQQYKSGWKTSKSRYLPVSHEKTIDYILSNRDARVIIIAVPCALQGILSVIEKYHLVRNNYLLIGLFCERNFQYNFVNYLETLNKNKKLVGFHFKNKESGGWPGNLKLFFEDGSIEYKDKSFRTNAKDFFQPERCLYCIDKLAINADIALGDNYTQIDSSELGSNSIIIRSKRGLSAWNECSAAIEYRAISYDMIAKAEAVEDRSENAYFAELKKKKLFKEGLYVPNINEGVIIENIPDEGEQEYLFKLGNLRIGLENDKQFTNYNRIITKAKRKRKKELIIYSIRSRLSTIVRKLVN